VRNPSGAARATLSQNEVEQLSIGGRARPFYTGDNRGSTVDSKAAAAASPGHPKTLVREFETLRKMLKEPEA
jgi:hypothetical protein